MRTLTSTPFPQRCAALMRGWATRSLAVGAVATLVDVGVLLACVHWLDFPNPLAAAVGVAVGSTVAFLGNRHFAFPDCEPEVGPQLLRFFCTVSVGMALHASLVHVLADLFAVPALCKAGPGPRGQTQGFGCSRGISNIAASSLA